MKNISAAEYHAIRQRYFRFDLLRREVDSDTFTSAQHNLLKFLSEEPFGPVFYVAPIFYRYSEYQRNVTQRDVLAQSLFIDLEKLKYVPDDDLHRIAFLDDGRVWQCSDPEQVGTGSRGNEIIESLTRSENEEMHDDPDPFRGDGEERGTQTDRRSIPSAQQIDFLKRLKQRLIIGIGGTFDRDSVPEISTDALRRLIYLRDIYQGYAGPWNSAALERALRLILDIHLIFRRYYDVTWLSY